MLGISWTTWRKLVPIAHSRRLRFVELRGLPLPEVHIAGRIGFRALDLDMKLVLATLCAG